MFQTDLETKGLIENPSKSMERFPSMSMDFRSVFTLDRGTCPFRIEFYLITGVPVSVCVSGLQTMGILGENASAHLTLHSYLETPILVLDNMVHLMMSH